MSNTTTTTTTTTSTSTSGSTTPPLTNPINDDTSLIRSMWEVASIFHYLNFFKQPLGLRILNIEDIENILLEPTKYTELISEIFSKLLKGLMQPRFSNNWQLAIRNEVEKQVSRLVYFDQFENRKKSPYDSIETNEQHQYSKLALLDRIYILKAACDWNLSKSKSIQTHIQEEISNDPDNLRSYPIAVLNENEYYWYFGENILYRETVSGTFNGNRKKSTPSKWEIVCQTKEEWEQLIAKYENSTDEDEEELFKNMSMVLPQVIAKINTRKRKVQRSVPVNAAPKEWKSLRLLEMNLRKMEQEKMIENDQQYEQQTHHIHLRPRSNNRNANYNFTNQSDDEDDDDDDNEFGKRRQKRNNIKDSTPEIKFTTSGRKVITRTYDENGLPVPYDIRKVEQKQQQEEEELEEEEVEEEVIEEEEEQEVERQYEEQDDEQDEQQQDEQVDINGDDGDLVEKSDDTGTLS